MIPAQRLVALVVIAAQLTTRAALAAGPTLTGNTQDQDQASMPSMTSEFIYRSNTEEPLIPVYLLGAVAKPGLYHVPMNTDLVSLIALAGGAGASAQADRIYVKGQGKDAARRQFKFDLEEAAEGKQPVRVALASNDLVYVTPGKPPLSSDILTGIGIVAGVLGIVASGFLISNAIKK